MKLAWLDEYLTDVLIVGFLLSGLQLIHYCWKRNTRKQRGKHQIALFVIKSVSQQRPLMVCNNR